MYRTDQEQKYLSIYDETQKWPKPMMRPALLTTSLMTITEIDYRGKWITPAPGILNGRICGKPGQRVEQPSTTNDQKPAWAAHQSLQIIFFVLMWAIGACCAKQSITIDFKAISSPVWEQEGSVSTSILRKITETVYHFLMNGFEVRNRPRTASFLVKVYLGKGILVVRLNQWIVFRISVQRTRIVTVYVLSEIWCTNCRMVQPPGW